MRVGASEHGLDKAGGFKKVWHVLEHKSQVALQGSSQ